MKASKKTNQPNNKSGIYSQIIKGFLGLGLSKGAIVLAGVIHSLTSGSDADNKFWVGRTKTLMNAMGVARSTINNYFNELVSKDVLEAIPNGNSKKYKLLISSNDVKDIVSIIPEDVLKINNDDLSMPYKFFYGYIVQRALGNPLEAWNWNNIQTLCEELGYSESSIYRLLSKLSTNKLVKRDNVSKWTIKPLDEWTKDQIKKFDKEKYSQEKEYIEYQEQLQKIPDADPKAIELIQNIFNSIK